MNARQHPDRRPVHCPDLCVDEDDQFTDVVLPAVFTLSGLDTFPDAADAAAAELDALYGRITEAWHELEKIERALRRSEPTSQRAARTRAWLREALGGLEYPVLRGLDEACHAMQHGAAHASPPPHLAVKHYRLTLPSALHHDELHHDQAHGERHRSIRECVRAALRRHRSWGGAGPRRRVRRIPRLLLRACRVGWIDRRVLERLPLRLLLWIAPLNQRHRAQVRAHMFVADAVFGDDHHGDRIGWLARHVGYDPELARQYRRHQNTGETHHDTEHDDGPGAQASGGR